MKMRISNDYGGFLQLIILLTGAVIIVEFFYILFQPNSDSGQRFAAAFISLLSIITCYYFGGFYRVSFDNDFVYITRLRSSVKVALENVENVKPGIFPIRFLFRNVYVVNLVYLENGRKRKIKFFSRGARGLTGTADNIPLLDSLRQQIRAKKYSAAY